MKSSTRLLIAVTLTLVLAIGAVGVWASAPRQGTVPIFPEEYTGSCEDEINFGTGTVTAKGTCELVVKVSPEPVETGELPEGWTGLFDYVSVGVTEGEAKSFTVCAPLSPDWEGKKAGKTLNWFVWVGGEWIEAKTKIEKGPPETVCGTSKEPGTFTLLGK